MPESVTLMLIEHDMDVAFGVADRVTVVVDGSELVTGSPEEVRSSPEVLAAYMRQVTQ
jgi:amino acid/amide ABC transporter ATP-binding protein 1, HAAT family (TC 3.A.1.4.-)